MSTQQTCYLIFATDGKGTTQLAHVYTTNFEKAFLAATQWRDTHHPNLPILRVRVEPNGFLVGPAVHVEITEKEEQQ